MTFENKFIIIYRVKEVYLEMPLKPKEMLKLLKANGFKEVKDEVKGGHQKMRNDETNRQTTVPMNSKELSKGEEHDILKQAGLK